MLCYLKLIEMQTDRGAMNKRVFIFKICFLIGSIFTTNSLYAGDKGSIFDEIENFKVNVSKGKKYLVVKPGHEKLGSEVPMKSSQKNQAKQNKKSDTIDLQGNGGVSSVTQGGHGTSPGTNTDLKDTGDSTAGNKGEDDSPKTITGDWGGKRKVLADKGLDIGLVYKGDYGSALSGGVSKDKFYVENLDMQLTVDAEKLWGLDGTTIFLYGLGNRGIAGGKVPSALVGDEQGTSNIEAGADDFKVYEAWVQKSFADEKASVLFGLHDLNSEFYQTDSSLMFLNSSFGIGREISQTGPNGPSVFPYTSVALRFRVEPTKNLYTQLGIFEAQSGEISSFKGTHFRLNSNDGFLMVSELGYNSKESPSKYGMGYWSYTRTFDHQVETLTDGLGNPTALQVPSSGAYFLADQSLNSSISAFLHYGVSASDAFGVKDCLTAGLIAAGLNPLREEDSVGLGIARVTPTGVNKGQMINNGLSVADSETTYELSYRAEVSPGVVLQPDLQLVKNPSFEKMGKDVTVGSVRIELSF